MADAGACQRLVDETVKRLGRLDVLVNNAATNPIFGPLLDMEEEAWDRIMALNVKGYLLAAQRAARASLHGVYRNPYTNDERVKNLSNSTANTNVVVHHGKLLALKEDSPPYALDPGTLENPQFGRVAVRDRVLELLLNDSVAAMV